MKISTQRSAGKQGLQLIYLSLLCIVLLLNSCTKDTTTVSTAYLSIVNTSPTLGTYNFYIDGTKLNTGAVPFGGMMAYASYTAGEHTANFTTESGVESLLSKKVNLEADGVYSLFLIEKPGNLDALLIRDVMTVTSTEQAFIRFINLSPDAPALDLTISEAANALVSAKSYKSASDFQAISPNTYAFDIKENGSANIRANLASVTLTAGKYYTILSRGLLEVGEIDQPFSGQLITNF